MRLTLGLPTYSAEPKSSWRFIFDRASLFDRCGVDRVVVSDHVVFGENLEEYGRPEVGGVTGGKQPTGPDGHWLEPMTVLSAIAAVTQRCRLGTNIIQAALRRPVVLAKAAATLDVISGGRLDLGVGVGWQREEYEAAGLDFDDRGRLLDHTIEVCQTLWREPTASFASPDLSFDRIHMMPKPIQPGGVPIWVSGTVNNRVARRLARYGQGWIPWGPAAADLGPALQRLRELVSAAGGNPQGFSVMGTLVVKRFADRTVDLTTTMTAIDDLRATGVTDVTAVGLPIPDDADEAADQVMAFVEAFRTAASNDVSDVPGGSAAGAVPMK